jgi:hypothetical protein
LVCCLACGVTLPGHAAGREHVPRRRCPSCHDSAGDPRGNPGRLVTSMYESLRRRLATIVVLTLLMGLVSMVAPSPAVAQARCSAQTNYYGIYYWACINVSPDGETWVSSGSARAASGTLYYYTNARLATRLLSDGQRITGKICDITSALNSGGGTNCIITWPRGHTGNVVQTQAWVAFDRRCRTVEPPSCIGYRSSHPGVKSPGWIS